MAFIAWHFHWSPDDLLHLDHKERRAWCRTISGINRDLDGWQKSDDPFQGL